MARFSVQVKSNNRFIRRSIDTIQKVGDEQTRRMAELAEESIKRNIQASITRANSSGNLSNSMFVSKILNGYGVGDIRYLNENAPYWRHVNFGSTAIGASHSHRVPTGSFNPGNPEPTSGGSGSRWTTGAGSFSFIPGQPIAPLNYIAKTFREIPSIINTVIG